MDNNFDVYILTNSQIAKKAGEKIKRWRIEQRVTQQELADNAGLGVTTIIAAEAGKNVSFETLIAILRALNKLDILETAFMQPESILPSLLYKFKQSQLKAQKQRVRKSKK